MSSPIELYLGQLRAKLETRFDSECADNLLSEIRAHLSDAVAELEEEGVARLEAERLSVHRFGAPEKAAFLMPLGQQFGTGDRYWGRGAFAIAVLAALGMTWYAFSPSSTRVFSIEDLRPAITLMLVVYAYACWRARSFAMVKQSAVVVAALVTVTSLLRLQDVDLAPRDAARGLLFKGLVAERTVGSDSGAPHLMLDASYSPGTLYADLGKPSENLFLADEGAGIESFPAPAPELRDKEESFVISGMAPIGQNPWALAQGGTLPEGSQLLLSWLFLLLMTNAAVCWVGCLEHEQKGGVSLVQ